MNCCEDDDVDLSNECGKEVEKKMQKAKGLKVNEWVKYFTYFRT